MKVEAGEYRWAPGFKGYTDTMGLPVFIRKANPPCSGDNGLPKGAQTCNVELASGRRVFTDSRSLGRRAPAKAVKAWKRRRILARVEGAVNSMNQTMEAWGDVLTDDERAHFVQMLTRAVEPRKPDPS